MNGPPTCNGTAPASQYQHYIPRFLLRNFAHSYPKPSGVSSSPTTLPHGQSRQRRRRQLDHKVNCLDLSTSPPIISEQLVDRIFGKINMYQNTSKQSADQNRVEEMLAKLENDASQIVSEIPNSLDGRHRGIWLTRHDRNLLRKFLFIMKYRGSVFHHRFCHEESATYFSNDKENLVKYMHEKGLARPMDVWLDNIEVILKLDMDDTQKWISELPKRMYPADAQWFIMHCQAMYMALCVPADSGDEFIITDNSYHVAEGPHCVLVNPSTGNSSQGIWASFHEFAPIAPGIMIVLRSSSLPSPLEDANPDVKAVRDYVWSRVVEPFQSGTRSMLADLPIEKARNNYSEVVQGRVQLVHGEDGKEKLDHKFFFRFFRIGTDHVNKINGIFLDNAIGCNNVVFSCTAKFRRTLEWYLTVDPAAIGKRTTQTPQDPRRIVLAKLADALKQLGSNKSAVWDSNSLEEQAKAAGHAIETACLEEVLSEFLGHIPDDSFTGFMKIYKQLGGSKQTLIKDMEQAELMWRLRVKIDVWSKGLEESLRAINRDHLIETYLQFPRRRVWFYLKVRRREVLGSEQQCLMHDPEDTIAKAHSIVKHGSLNRLMYISARNDIEVKSFPEFDSWNSVLLGRNRHESALRLSFLAVQDSVQNCGIEPVEELAKCYQQMNQQGPETQPKVELMTRMKTLEQFQAILEGRLDANLLQDLAELFFSVVYPTPIMSEA